MKLHGVPLPSDDFARTSLEAWFKVTPAERRSFIEGGTQIAKEVEQEVTKWFSLLFSTEPHG